MCQAKPYPRCSNHARLNLAAVRANPKATKEQISEAVHDWQISPEGIEEARKNGDDFQADLRTAERAAIVLSAQKREARSLSTSPERLHVLVKSKDTTVRAMVASSDDLTPATLDLLSHDKDLGVLETVAGNPITPSENLATIYNSVKFVEGSPIRGSKSLDVRKSLARNRNTSAQILGEMMNSIDFNYVEDSEDSSLAQAIASNPSTPHEALVTMRGNGEVGARMAAEAQFRKRGRIERGESSDADDMEAIDIIKQIQGEMND